MDLYDLEKTLLQPDFDVEKYASNLLQSGVDIGKHANELNAAERELDSQLEEHVTSHHNDLLTQATSVERLDLHISSVSDQSENLLSLVDRLSNRVTEPFNSMKTQTETLIRMQKTCDVLRKIDRIFQLSKKLQNQMQGGTNEITKAASTLSELMELWQPEDELSGIDIIEPDKRMMIHARHEVERSADAMLASGMESKSQNQMGIALQVFFNLNVLPEKVNQVMNNMLKDVKSNASELLDGKRINASLMEEDKKELKQGGGGKSLPGRTSRTITSVPSSDKLTAFRTILWSNIDKLLDGIHDKISEAMQLQKILTKKRDVSMGINFIELLDDNKRNIVILLWSECLSILKSHLTQSSADSSTVKEAMEDKFPKLIGYFSELWSKLYHAAQNNNAAFNVPDLNLTLKNPFECRDKLSDELRQVIIPYERQYLSRSLSRLFDPVNLMFVAGEAPQKEELDKVFKAINSEVAYAQVDKVLHDTVIKNVAKTVKLMCAKCEHLIDCSASQVVGYPTNEQRRNVEVVNCLFSFYVGIESILGGSNNDYSSKDIEKLIKSAIEPLIQSVIDAVEAILITMHNENFNLDTVYNYSFSPYMRELNDFIAKIHGNFLSKFDCKTLVAESTFPLGQRTIDLFILHASIVRPVSANGQIKLSQDCDHLEKALEPIFNIIQAWNPVCLETKLEELVHFKTLITTKTEEITPESKIIKEKILKPSIVLHVLFSRAPNEIKSPHESAGWSISRYSSWLEDHQNETDRLQLIQGALESYVAATKAKKEKSFAFPYNLMLNVLQSVV